MRKTIADINFKSHDVMNILPCGYIITDAAGNIVFSNAFFCKLMESTAEEITKRSIQSYLSRGSRIYFDTHVRPLLYMQGSVREIGLELYRDISSTVPIVLNAIAEKNEETDEITHHYTLFDASQRRLFEKELMSANEKQGALIEKLSELNNRLGNFTHLVSHDLRSYVGNLQGLMSIMDLDDKEDTATNFEMINLTVEKLTETIKNLGKLIDIDSDKEQLIYKEINLKKRIDAIIASIQWLVDEANATFEIELDGTETANGIDVYLDSILLNLITNTLKYRSPKRDLVVRITYKESAGSKIVSVTDNGLGIDLEKDGEKLFGLYQTFHSHKDSKGMGLYLTKNQALSMGGDIEVESEVDKGSTFRVILRE